MSRRWNPNLGRQRDQTFFPLPVIVWPSVSQQHTHGSIGHGPPSRVAQAWSARHKPFVLGIRRTGRDRLGAAFNGIGGMAKGARAAGMAHDPKTTGQTLSDLEVLQSTVGARVREARIRAKLKQSELGALIGSGQSHVFEIEDGRINVTLKTLVKLANALSVKPVDLLLDSGVKPKLADSVASELANMLQSTKADLSLIGERLHRVEMLLAGESEDTKPASSS